MPSTVECKKDKILTIKKLHTSKCVLSPLSVAYMVSSSAKFLTNLKFCLLYVHKKHDIT